MKPSHSNGWIKAEPTTLDAGRRVLTVSEALTSMNVEPKGSIMNIFRIAGPCLVIAAFQINASFAQQPPPPRRPSQRLIPVPPVEVVAKLTASDSQAGDLFGFCTAVAGDVAVIGARHVDHSGKTDAGAAYVFHRSGSEWTEVQRLVAPDADDYDYFGQWVAATEDMIFVSAVFDDHSGMIDAGSVYVFTRSGDVWTFDEQLFASDAGEHDEFGWCPSVDGETLVVGTWRGGPGDEGAAYVFSRVGGSWIEQQRLTSPDGGGAFGAYTALEAQTLVLGAPFHDLSNLSDAGAAYVFIDNGGTWTQHQKLTASDAGAGDTFGVHVAISNATIVVNSPNDDHSSLDNAGSAYVFTLDGDTWIEHQKLVALEPAPNAWGWFVDIEGEMLTVGANLADPYGMQDAGAAYVYRRIGDTWTEIQKIVAPDAAAGDNFGWPVPISGDTVITGAPWNDYSSMTDPGAAYVIRLPVFFDGFESADTSAWSHTVP